MVTCLKDEEERTKTIMSRRIRVSLRQLTIAAIIIVRDL